MAYPYNTMSKKAGRFRSSSVFDTFYATYSSVQLYLGDGYSGAAWQTLLQTFGEDVLQAILLAQAVTGVACIDWNTVFTAVYKEYQPFQNLTAEQRAGRISPDWLYFAAKLAKETTYAFYLPPTAPTYLFTYGVTRPMYERALDLYWDNIHLDYYVPWAATRTAYEVLEFARMKQIGEEARRKMDRVARQAIHTLKHQRRRT